MSPPRSALSAVREGSFAFSSSRGCTALTYGVLYLILPPFLVSFDFDSDQALQDVLRSDGRIALVLVLGLIVLWLTQRLLTPLLRVAVREHMEKEPEVEIKKRVDTLSHVLYTTIYVASLSWASSRSCLSLVLTPRR